ncbi:MAG: hypothetical protein JSS02_21435, partial [Planctomycetes bacterium]|nr:hypothetical protein [Planctomycetota bacterium]
MTGQSAEQSVLTIPLLLHLLRQYAEREQLTEHPHPESLPDLRNRYSIYRKVIVQKGGLIERGFQTLEKRESPVKDLFRSPTDAFHKVSQVGWWLAQRHHFDTL